MSDKGEGTVQGTLTIGNIMNITKTTLKYGYIDTPDIKGWIDLTKIAKTEEHEHITGDINNDGEIDKYDLSLLNSYLQAQEILPEGISTLTSSQLKAADLNGDGIVDLADVSEYLLLI